MSVPDPLTSALSDRYTIERKLGEGGMASVYLAQDLKHNRSVALKVLKPELSAVVGAERFLAEIETTANLQHPHILPLFDSGEAGGFLYYVMPFVEGETLKDRLEREGQLPVDEGVRIARAVAGGLDYAHRRGVVHRDIKPGNILLQDGEPVLADFGIAIAVGAGGGRLTETGLSVGTPYYMSPEQATGDQQVGPPSDTYSLACVLYEMLVGEPPYLGSTAQAVLGKIIQGDPVSATASRRSIPAHVDAAIRKALEKLPADRFTTAEGFAKALADPGFRHGEVADTAAVAGRWRPAAIAGWGVAALLAGVLTWTSTLREAPNRVGHFAITTEEGSAYTGFGNILSDGSGMIHSGPSASGPSMLWIRRWEDPAGTPIRGTEGASLYRVSVSPDGRELLYSQGYPGPLKVVPLLGGPVRTLADAAYGGGLWSADGETVYFMGVDTRMYSVSRGGGEATKLLEQPGRQVAHWLLDDDGIVLFRQYGGGESYVAALKLATGEVTTITEGTSPIAVIEGGHLVFGTTDGAVMAAPFDADALELTAVPTLMVDGIGVDSNGHGGATVSRNGSLLYIPSSPNEATPVWVDRNGGVVPIDPEWSFPVVTTWSGLALAPDGGRLVLSIFDAGWHLWMKDFDDDGLLSKFTFEGTINRRPSWSEDGESVLFISNVQGLQGLWSRRADGSQPAEPVLQRENSFFEGLVAPGGEWIVFRDGSGSTSDIYAVAAGDTTARALAASDATEWEAAVSPNGRWLAYSTNESGQYEVIVRSFPGEGLRQQVSVGGGREPVWSRSGDELFYRGGTHYIAAAVTSEPTFAVRERIELFPVGPFLLGAGRRMYDVHPDGDRFVMLHLGETVPSALMYIQDWASEIDARLGR